MADTPVVDPKDIVIAQLQAHIEALEGEAAGRALMDAEGEAFLPEGVKQLQTHIEVLKDHVRRLWQHHPACPAWEDYPDEEPETCTCGLPAALAQEKP